MFVIAMFTFLWACKNDPPLPQTPEAVVEQWQTWINENNFVQAKRLSTKNTKDWINWMSKVLDENNLTEETPSVFHKIDCQLDGTNALCACLVEELGELYADTFYLKQEQTQWLIDIPEEELEMSSTLDSLFQMIQ